MNKKKESSKKTSGKRKEAQTAKSAKSSKSAKKDVKAAESKKTTKDSTCSIESTKGAQASKFTKVLIFILVLILVLMGADFFVQYLNNHASIAVVDGHRISRSEYIERLEEMHGDQVANMLVEEKIIDLIGAEEGINIETEDVDEEYAKVAEQSGGEEALEQTLAMYGMQEGELRAQLRQELILREIVGPTLEYTDEDLGEFFEQNKEFIYPNAEDVDFDEEKDEIEDIYIQDQVHQQRGQLIQEFRDDISIQLNTPQAIEQEGREYELFKATRNVINNLLGREVDDDEVEDELMQDDIMMEGLEQDMEDMEIEIDEDMDVEDED